MEQPLGNQIGNALEVMEAIQTLKGQGPEDLTTLVIELAAHMALLAEKVESLEEARSILKEHIETGVALNYLKTFITAQGGDPRVIDDFSLLPQAKEKIVLKAKNAGYVEALFAEELGKAAMLLGAGRQTKDDRIDLGVGLELHKKVGDQVSPGEALCTVHTNRSDIEPVLELVEKSIVISDKKVSPPLLLETIK